MILFSKNPCLISTQKATLSDSIAVETLPDLIPVENLEFSSGSKLIKLCLPIFADCDGTQYPVPPPPSSPPPPRSPSTGTKQ
jgi:hypothetical protein